MPTARSTISFSACRARLSGFTLTELMVTVAVIGVLIGMSAPYFGRTLEQSRADFAVANLRAIWAAQRLYWLENHAYTADWPTLRTLKLLDPLLDPTTPTGEYTYTITLGGSDTLEAKATRAPGTSWTGWFTIDQDGTTGGFISAGAATITPGFR